MILSTILREHNIGRVLKAPMCCCSVDARFSAVFPNNLSVRNMLKKKIPPHSINFLRSGNYPPLSKQTCWENRFLSHFCNLAIWHIAKMPPKIGISPFCSSPRRQGRLWRHFLIPNSYSGVSQRERITRQSNLSRKVNANTMLLARTHTSKAWARHENGKKVT